MGNSKNQGRHNNYKILNFLLRYKKTFERLRCKTIKVKELKFTRTMKDDLERRKFDNFQIKGDSYLYQGNTSRNTYKDVNLNLKTIMELTELDIWKEKEHSVLLKF